MSRRYLVSTAALAALLAAGPLATCLVAVRAHAATAMAAEGDCDAPRSGEAPALCGLHMVGASAPAGVAAVPAALPPAAADSPRWAPGLALGAPHPARDAGPPGHRPPAWLRHRAFLI